MEDRKKLEVRSWKSEVLKVFFAFLLFTFALSCEAQVPSVGGMQKPGAVADGEISYCYPDDSFELGTVTNTTTKSIVAQSTNARKVVFSASGHKMYVLDYITGLYQYSLDPAWDISTASYDNEKIDPSNNLTGLCFDKLGNNFYICDISTDDAVRYSMTTPWDISTATYADETYIGSPEPIAYGLTISCDGNYLYFCGSNRDRVYQRILHVPYELASTGTSTEFYVGGFPGDIRFSPDGARMFIVDNNSDAIKQYNLTIPWTVTSASYSNKSATILNDYAAFFIQDGTKLWGVNGVDDLVYEYTNE